MALFLETNTDSWGRGARRHAERGTEQGLGWWGAIREIGDPEKGKHAQGKEDSDRGRDCAEYVGAFGSDTPGCDPRPTTGTCEKPRSLFLHLRSEETLSLPAGSSQQFRARLPPGKQQAPNSCALRPSEAARMAEALWGRLARDRTGAGHRPPTAPTQARLGPASLSARRPARLVPHPTAPAPGRQVGTHLCAPAGCAGRPGLPSLWRAADCACAVAVSELLNPCSLNAVSELDYISQKPLQAHAPPGLVSLDAGNAGKWSLGGTQWGGREHGIEKCLAVLTPQIFPF